ncbi:MAG: DNA-binding response regulator [Lachnospiraceae bacterium]
MGENGKRSQTVPERNSALIPQRENEEAESTIADINLKETYEKALREALMRYQGKEASTWNQKLLDTENDPERRKLLEQIGQKIRELDFEEAESIFQKVEGGTLMEKKHVLIVDDDLILLKTAEEILSEFYSVSVAKAGSQAIALLEKGVIPDLILLDIAMPGMDGYETLNEMKKIPAAGSVPIIFLTGFSDADYEVRGLKSGAVDYIVKPFVKEVLLARVERHLQYEEGRAREERTEEIKENETYKKMQEVLSPIEWKIAQAIAKGMDNREIAAEYHYSYGYVKNVITRIFSKLEVEKRRDLRKMFEG